MIKVFNDVGENWKLGLQEEGSPIAVGIVDFHNHLMYYLIIIFSLVTYFMIARIYKVRSISRIKYINHSTVLELIWTIIPAIILIIIAIPSFKLLWSLDEIVKPLVTLKIKGNQWFWNYEISDIDGLNVNFDSYTKSEEDLALGELRLLEVDNRVLLPIQTPIRLLITGEDVIHSFGVPALGLKTDGVPGRINHSSLYLLRPGTYYGQCSELCGASHERMSIVIQGVSIKEYLQWLKSNI